MRSSLSAGLLALAAATATAPAFAGDDTDSTNGSPALQLADDPTGVLGIVNLNGPTRTDGPFFQSLGTNGRSCSSCHVAEQGLSLSAIGVRARFDQSHGRDPLFAPVDCANCPSVKQGDRAGHSLLLQSGLIRVALPLPANAQFTISVVHDPYGCAIVPDPNGGQPRVAVYRRPLPTTNLAFLSAVMIDGRETVAPLNNGRTFSANLITDLTHQATDATLIHAQATQPPSASQLSGIVGFEMGLFTAQARDQRAGGLAASGAQGGPFYLAKEDYYPGINDSLGADPKGEAFNAAAMTLFTPWATLPRDGYYRDAGERTDARRAIAAGEAIFNSAPLQIANVRAA
jgi:hypothetical protein